MHKLLLLPLLLSTSLLVQAQKEWVNWNSSSGGLTFKSDTGILYSDVPKGLAWPDYIGEKAYSYSSTSTGSILFLTDGRSIWNKNYKCIVDPVKDTLISCISDYYKVQIVPFANDSTKFYIFHLYSAKGFVSTEETLIPNACSNKELSYLYYSILQMDSKTNTGKLISINNPILKYPLDRVSMIKHANKKDTWIIAHPQDSSYYVSFLVTDTIVHQPVISRVGPLAPFGSGSIKSSIAASPDGGTIAAASSGTLVEVYNFNKSTGVLSNYRKVELDNEAVVSLCFSPDNTKLYIAASDKKGCDDYGKIYQVDFNESDLNKSLFVVKKYTGRQQFELSKAKDNRIWVKGANYDGRNYFDVIEYPNQPKNACVLTAKHLRYGSQVYIPNIINNYIEQSKETPVTKLNMPDTLKVCFGKTSVTAPAGYESYVWNTGDSTTAIEITRPGLYTVLAGKKGFSKPDAYGYVNVVSTAAEAFKADDTLFCPKTLNALTVPNNISNIVWMDGDTKRVKPVVQDYYKLTGVDNNGCKVWDSICVTVHTDPMVSFGKDTILCPYQTLQLNMPTYRDSINPLNIKESSYLWQDSSAKNSFNITQSGTYWGNITFNGCSVADTINVKYVSLPDVKLGNDVSICEGDSLALSVAPSDAHYLWSTGDTVNAIKARKTGQYWVKVSKEICVHSDTMQLTVKPLPVIALPRDTTLCPGASLMLAPSKDTSYGYRWQNGDTVNRLRVTTAGTYSVTAKKNGCTNTATIKVDYISLPQVELGRDTILCEGKSLSLYVAPSDASYLWNTGSTFNQITVAQTGTYWVNVSKSICAKTDTLHLTVKSLPVIALPNDTVICAGTSLVLSPSTNTSYKYKWQNGDTSNTFVATTAGTYSVTAKNDICALSDTIKIGIMNTPFINLMDTFLCKQGKLLLDLHILPTDHAVWQDQSTKHTYLITTPGVYAVRTSNKCGTDYKQITVTEKLCELNMPTAFTPNNDGRNDVFRVKYPELVKSLHLSIYNRMGQKIFETSDPYKGWDGTINGMPQPMGTYIYNVTYTDVENNKQSLNGYLVMVR